VREALRPGLNLFEVVGYDVTTRLIGGTTATVTLRVQDSVHTATANGQGPMNALDLCLRQCLSSVYPKIASVRLTDYKVRVLEPKKGTAAKCGCCGMSDHKRSWATVGVSDNVIEASWHALVDAIRLELMRLTSRTKASTKWWKITAGASNRRGARIKYARYGGPDLRSILRSSGSVRQER